jgi:hypothetical protein
LLRKIARTDGSSDLASGFESSVPGLHFVGSSSLTSYGPLMRFVAGAGYAARSVTRKLMRHRSRSAVADVRLIDGTLFEGSARTISRP